MSIWKTPEFEEQFKQVMREWFRGIRERGLDAVGDETAAMFKAREKLRGMTMDEKFPAK